MINLYAYYELINSYSYGRLAYLRSGKPFQWSSVLEFDGFFLFNGDWFPLANSQTASGIFYLAHIFNHSEKTGVA